MAARAKKAAAQPVNAGIRRDGDVIVCRHCPATPRKCRHCRGTGLLDVAPMAALEGLIVHADFARLTLDTFSVDVVITDPPYSAKVHSAQRIGCTGCTEPTRPGAQRAQFNRSKELGFAHLTPELRGRTCEQLRVICRRWALIFSDTEGVGGWISDLETAGMEYVRTMIWRKLGATPQFTGDRPATGHECIVVAHQRHGNRKPMIKRWNGGGKHGVYEYPIVINRDRKSPRLHTTQKPLELMRALVRDFSDPGELVFDPFAGSGTTLLAAEIEGRRWMGIEIDGRYARVARKRIAK